MSLEIDLTLVKVFVHDLRLPGLLLAAIYPLDGGIRRTCAFIIELRLHEYEGFDSDLLYTLSIIILLSHDRLETLRPGT